MSVLTRISYHSRLLQVPVSESSRKRNLKVAVLGANGKTGRPLSLLLKQCPKYTEVALYDKESTIGLAAELEQVDTSSTVSSKSGPGALTSTLRGAEIIVMMAGSRDVANAFENNAPIVAKLSESCAEISPKALLVVVTNPVNSLVPMVTEIYRRVNKIVDYNRIFGLTSADTVRAACFVAEVLSVPAEKVSVPVVGGTGPETVVPVLNNLPLGTEEAVRVTSATREASQKQHPLSAAYAISKFVLALAKALVGQQDVVECAYVHSNSFSHSPSPYLSTPLQLGPAGLEKNLGLPPLSQYEQCLLETALPALLKDIEQGNKFAQKFTLKH